MWMAATFSPCAKIYMVKWKRVVSPFIKVFQNVFTFFLKGEKTNVRAAFAWGHTFLWAFHIRIKYATQSCFINNGRKEGFYHIQAYLSSVQHKLLKIVCIREIISFSWFDTITNIEDFELVYLKSFEMNQPQIWKDVNFLCWVTNKKYTCMQ